MAVSESTNAVPEVTKMYRRLLMLYRRLLMMYRTPIHLSEDSLVARNAVSKTTVGVSEIKDAASEAIDAVLKTAKLEITIFVAVSEALNAVSEPLLCWRLRNDE